MYNVTVYQIPNMKDVVTYTCYSRDEFVELTELLEENLDSDRFDYEYLKILREEL